MVLARKGKAKRSGKGKRRMMKKRRGMGGKGDIARVTQTISFSASQNPQVNVIQKMYNFSLTNCDRAIQVARGYQYYRIKYIKATFKPHHDTYTQGLGGNPSGTPPVAAPTVPYLYYYIDKTGSFLNNNINFNSMRDAGCKPKRFDDKAITIAWKPVVVTSTFNFDANLAPWAADTKVSPWIFTNANALSTNTLWNANSTEHLGLVFGVEQDNVGVTPQQYDVDLTYVFEFKKPTYQSSTGSSSINRLVDLNSVSQPPEGGPYSGTLVQDS